MEPLRENGEAFKPSTEINSTESPEPLRENGADRAESSVRPETENVRAWESATDRPAEFVEPEKPQNPEAQSPERIEKPPAPFESSERLDKEVAVRMEDNLVKGDGLRHRLDKEARRAERDPFSTAEQSPDPDDGLGPSALARAFVERAKNLEAAGKLSKDGPVLACEVGTDTGLGAKRFVETVKRENDGLYRRLRMIVATDNPKRHEAIVKSGMFEGHPGVEVRLVATNDPDQVPDGALAVLFDRTLNRMPGHRLVNDPDTVRRGYDRVPILREVREGAWVKDSGKPIITIDEAGLAKPVFPDSLSDTCFIGVAESARQVLDLGPQLHGRLVSDSTYGDPALDPLEIVLKELTELHQRGALAQGEYTDQVRKVVEEYRNASRYRCLGPDLQKREDDVSEFMDRQPAGYPTNFTPGATELVESALQKTHPDALIMITGPQRMEVDHGVPVSGLRRQQGLLTESIVDAEHVRMAVERAMGEDAPEKVILTHQDEPCGYAYLIVDRAGQGEHPEWRIPTEFQLENMPRHGIDLQRLIEDANAKLTISGEGGSDAIKDTVKYIEGKVEYLSGKADVAGSYTVALELSRVYNSHDGPEDLAVAALKHAEQAAAIMPYASAPQVQIAIASLKLKKLDQAWQALALAREASPRNSTIYLVGIQAAMQNKNPREKQREYIKNLTEYIRYAPHLSTKETVDLHTKLCEAKEYVWKANASQDRHFKTVWVWNTETDEMTKVSISEAAILQIQAAEAWKSAWGAIEPLLNASAYDTGSNQERQRIVSTFVEGFRRTCFYDESGQPKPRDSWPDCAPDDEPSVLIYEGDIHQSDQEAPPDNILAFLQEQNTDNGEITARNGQDVEHGQTPLDEIELGEIIDPAGNRTGQHYPLNIDTMGQHGLILGTTGSGKTVTIKRLYLNLPKMGMNGILIACGDKTGEYDDMPARMEGVRVVRLGIDDVSLNLYNPDENTPQAVKDAMGRIEGLFKKVYDEMKAPFTTIISNSLRLVYSENGWDVGDPQYPTVGMEPTVPTLEQHLQAALRATKDYYTTQGKDGSVEGSETQRTIQGFFTGRFTELAEGPAQVAIESGKPISLEEVANGNIIFDTGYIKSPDAQRLVSLAFFDRITEHIMKTRGSEGGRVRTQIFLEEAHRLIGLPKDRSNSSREEQLQTIGDVFRQIRAAKTAIVACSQTANIHPVVFSQASWRMTFTLTDADNRATVAKDITGNDTEAAAVRDRMHQLNRGEAIVWTRGSQPVAIRTVYDPRDEPSSEAARTAFKKQPPLPISKTHIDREEIEKAATAPENALPQIFIHAIYLSHATGSELPPKAPDQLKAWWKNTKTKNPELADRILRRMVGNIVGERAKSVNEGQHPRIVGNSVYKIARGMLEGMPTGDNRHVSASFVVPQIAWVKYMRDLTTPTMRPVPPPDNFAPPLEHRIPGLNTEIGSSVGEAVEDLRRVRLSPLWKPDNTQIARRAVEGGEGGKPTLWSTIRQVADRVPLTTSIFPGRRDVSELLGYNERHYPAPGPLENALDLAALAKRLGNETQEELRG